MKILLSLIMLAISGLAYAEPVTTHHRGYTMTVHPCGLHEFTDPQPRVVATRVQAQARPVQARENPIDAVVRISQKDGLVSNYSLSDTAPTISVRPAFHEMDIEEKRAIAMAFFLHAKLQRPDAGYKFIMIRDSRNNNQVGTLAEGFGLRLNRAYR